MSDTATNPWTMEQSFAWQATQPERYELVAGYPIQMMAEAKNVHDDIVINLLTILRNKLRDIDTFEKIPEYKAHQDIDYILIVEPNAAEVILWSRMPDRSWHRSFTESLHVSIELPGLATSTSLAELYEDRTFPQRPRPIRHTIPNDKDPD